jgi:hypothetical protein
MMPSSPTPKLPLWIFIVTDVALLLAGLLIAAKSPAPLSPTSIFAVVACVVAGAIVLFVPLVSRIEREKNEALDDRQRALEALAATIATSADQISIAAQGQHTIAELARKNLALAEQLPAKFQDKITEFETLLNTAQADEREELKKELARLRASESDRLEEIATKVDHAARELAKLEANTQKHLAGAQAALAAAPEALTAATAAALAKISAALAAIPVPAATPQEDPKSTKSPSKSVEEGLHIVPIVPPTAAPFAGNIMTEPPNAAFDVTMPPFGGNLISSSPLAVPATAPAPVPAPESATPSPVTTSQDEPQPTPTDAGAPAAVEAAPAEPKPVKKRAPRKPKPVEPAEPALGLEPDAPAPVATPQEEPGPVAALLDDAGPTTSEFSQIAPDESPRSSAEVTESVISSDSATRLLVTAYIGIGNRLFIRGEGPGLSWEKGVPLQFVSIGKWRWETNDATAPVKFKLYKNDEIECTALGSQSLNPEHQQEISATF